MILYLGERQRVMAEPSSLFSLAPKIDVLIGLQHNQPVKLFQDSG
jgi:hypothetical protein